MGLVIDTSTVAPHERTELWSATTGVLRAVAPPPRPAPGPAGGPRQPRRTGGHAPDIRPSTRERLPAAHMRAIKAYIDEHLGDPTLGPESIARSQFISTRYLHALFEPEGLTVSRWVRTRRLERARRDLQDPALAAVPIGVIAARWGFSSPSRFSHAVRADLGCSPSELRAAAARRRPPS